VVPVTSGGPIQIERFYERYVAECSEMGVAPLAPAELLALIKSLVAGSSPTVH
jgi:hypothetical protein